VSARVVPRESAPFERRNDRGVARLGSILSKLRLPGPGAIALARIQASLEAVFGDAAARDLRVAGYRKGRLLIDVRSAARAFEWQAFARSDALDRLRGRPGLEELSEIAFRNGAWRAHGQQ
jgi:hypothetical protein